MQKETIALIQKYYDAFNRHDLKTFFDLVDDHVMHDINQGQRETGKEAFQKFMTHMDHCYKEKVSNIVVFANEDGTRAAAEFLVEGTYLATDPGFPEAKNQTYQLPAGAFFGIRSGKITRITNYYNVKDWVKLVSK